MPPGGKNGAQGAAERALRALERGATSLTAQAARSVHRRWRRMPAARPTKVERLLPPAPTVQPPVATSDVSDIEVRDLRAELARELERLADADISASRGNGKVAGEAPPPTEQS